VLAEARFQRKLLIAQLCLQFFPLAVSFIQTRQRLRSLRVIAQYSHYTAVERIGLLCQRHA